MIKNCMPNPTVGLFGIGLDTYWPQFPGLKERLTEYQTETRALLEKAGATVIDAELVDSVQKARAAARLFREKTVSIVFLHITTYALSQTVLPIAQGIGVPIIIINMQPAKNIDYSWFNSLGDRALMTAEWLANCQSCCVPEIANVFNRNSIPYYLVTGFRGEEFIEHELTGWIKATRVAEALRSTNIGILGHYYEGMLDVYTDVTRMAGTFGSHFSLIEMDDLVRLRRNVTAAQVQGKIAQLRQEFDVVPECELSELERAASNIPCSGRSGKRKRSGSSGILLRRSARQRISGYRNLDDSGKYTIDCTSCAGCRRMRNKERNCNEDPGSIGRWGLVLGVLSDRLRG